MKGIHFKRDMIQAIIEKRKTVTRRLDGLKEINREPDAWKCVGDVHSYNSGEARRIGFEHKRLYLRSVTPRYQVGETVYIKEAWQIRDCGKAVSLSIEAWPNGWPINRIEYDDLHDFSKRSPLFMPGWAARYFIAILGNSAELLRLPLSSEEMKLEGGEAALPMLEKINGLWVFRYEFEYRGGLNE